MITVRVPLAFRKHGGRKQILTADGAAWASAPQPDSTLVKALARAFRWRKLLEDGVHATVSDLAIAEKINPSYVSRILRLTLLAPDIVEAVLNGVQPPSFSLARAMRPFPVEWAAQRQMFDLGN
ncbi:MAG TPA: hypothetical protein VG889_00920 [Rhizomicrobium sp.]|nr:hypothetical protein [Rhizomicrobium sp.]